MERTEVAETKWFDASGIKVRWRNKNNLENGYQPLDSRNGLILSTLQLPSNFPCVVFYTPLDSTETG